MAKAEISYERCVPGSSMEQAQTFINLVDENTSLTALALTTRMNNFDDLNLVSDIVESFARGPTTKAKKRCPGGGRHNRSDSGCAPKQRGRRLPEPGQGDHDRERPGFAEWGGQSLSVSGSRCARVPYASPTIHSIPGFNGASLSSECKDALCLWHRFADPAALDFCVESEPTGSRRIR